MKRDYKIAVDKLVAERSGVHLRHVGPVLNELYAFLREELVQRSEVTIPGVGTLRRYKVRLNREVVLTQGHFAGKDARVRVYVKDRVRICFSQARQLRKALKEGLNMDKLGVDEGVDQESLEKRAANGCPLCGSPVERHGRVLSCPKHGTEPFEKDAWPQKSNSRSK